MKVFKKPILKTEIHIFSVPFCVKLFSFSVACVFNLSQTNHGLFQNLSKSYNNNSSSAPQKTFLRR